MDLREELTKAGNTHDGHVTNGSINEQLKVIEKYLAQPVEQGDQHGSVTAPCPYHSKTVMTFIREEN